MAHRRALIWLVSLGAPVLAIVVVALVWGWDLLIPLVERSASAALGRPVTIAHLHISPGRIVRITAEDVVVGNPPDWEGEPLARVPRLTVDADAWAYIRNRDLVVPLVVVERPVVLATQTANGGTNYQLQLASSTGPGAQIGEVRIEEGRAQVRLAKLQADFQLQIATGSTGDAGSQLIVDARGTYAAQPIAGRLVGGALLSLRDADHPWPVDLRLRNGPTSVTLNGTLMNPLTLAGASLKLQLAGPDMSLLEKLVGLPIPRTPNYEVTGQLEFADGRIRFRDFSGRMGNSDLAGTIDVDPAKDPPQMTAKLRSRSVDLADLGGFIGSTPGRVGTAGQSPAERAEVAKAEASPRFLPDAAISVPKLHWADIHLEYVGQHILGRAMPLDQLSVVLDVVNGQVTVHPISFAVGSGRIRGNIALTPDQNAVHAKADVEFQRIDVARLMAATQVFNGAGTISGTADIDGVGASLGQILGNGSGGLRVGMMGGDLSALLVNLSGLQFGKAILSALGLPTRTPVECFIGDLGLRNGTATIQALVLDTGEAVVEGRGSVNLKDESVHLQVRAEAKHFTIGSLPAPINVDGTLKNPSIMPGAELLARGGAAAGLGIAFPPLALLPTIQFGTGDDNRCEYLMGRAKQRAGGERLPGGRRSTQR
ncbi:MAG: AsmA family protein [Acetobacteraceae bacterium]